MFININLLFVIILLSFIICCIESTVISRCPNGSPATFDSIKSVNITDCIKPPCYLRKNTNVSMEQVFVPKKDINILITSVYAKILGVYAPFVGVNGKSACNDVYNIDGTKAGCKLKANETYIYKNTFGVSLIYPEISLVVYWALKESNDIITCFEVPAAITRH